jgi:hypothetical protein
MTMTKRIFASIGLLCLVALPLAAQEEETEIVATPLDLEVTLSPGPDGSDRGTSFTLYLLADSKRTTTLRSGREVAVPTAGNQYRNVGINASCRAWTSGDGYRLDLELEKSSLVEGNDPVRPSFNIFNATVFLRMRDGETARVVAGSDIREITAKLRVKKD